MRKITVFIIAFAILLIPCVAYADSSVEYGNASEFIFNPGSTDLFENFKGLMPGDYVEQKIVIANTTSNVPVTIFLKAQPQTNLSFLEYITFNIYFQKTETSEPKLLSSNKASEAGSLYNFVELGTFAPGEKGYIIVTAGVDKETGNVFKSQSGIVRWIFQAEEGEPIVTKTEKPTAKPIEKTTKDSDSPFTGSNTKPIIAACSAAGLALIVIVITTKKKNEDVDI